MKKTKLLLSALMIAGTSALSAQIVVTDADLGSGTYNWTADNEYLLDGFVFLEAGGVLNIAPGTVIKGKETPTGGDLASTLIITQGAQIIANGTADEPIIFTSELDDVAVGGYLSYTDRALCGGLIILGNATIGNATSTAAIEGIPTDDPRGTYGGANDADNSGSLKYISIRHGGAEIGAGNEINGLTLGGVGSGTILEHIEVYANLDDGIEFFGGTVNIKWAAVSFCGDDSFDWDQGYRGKGQFWFVLQDANSADNAGELDGATPDGATPFANPNIFNATFIGSGVGAAAENATATLFRDATAGTFGNSIFTEFAQHAIEVEDLPAASGIDSRQRMENGDLNLLNNLYFGFGTGDEWVAGELIRVTTDAEDAAATFLVNHMTSNNNEIVDPELNGISRITDGGLDPRPAVDGPAYTTAQATEPADAFYSDVDYKGAFSADETPWVVGWTALDINGHLSQFTSITQNEAVNNIGLYPNPVAENATLSFNLAHSSNLSLFITDISGKRVATIADANEYAVGVHTIRVNTSNLPSGVYFLHVAGTDGNSTIQFIK